MFPGVDGFHWTFGHVFFISVFLMVAAAIAAVAVVSLMRARRDVSADRGRCRKIGEHERHGHKSDKAHRAITAVPPKDVEDSDKHAEVAGAGLGGKA